MIDYKRLENTTDGNWHKGFYNDGKYNKTLDQIKYVDYFPKPPDEDFPLDDANCLWAGACDYFALELSKALGYDIYKMKGTEGGTHHTFCKTQKNGVEYYVDARGMTSDFGEFKNGLETFVWGNPQITKIGRQDIENDVNKDLENDDNFSREAINFAQEVILRYTCCYEF